MRRGRLVIVLVLGHLLFFAGCVATGDVPVKPLVEGPCSTLLRACRRGSGR